MPSDPPTLGVLDFENLGECNVGDCLADATNVTEEGYCYCATHVRWFYRAVAALGAFTPSASSPGRSL